MLEWGGVRHPKAEDVAHMKTRVVADMVDMDACMAVQHSHMVGIADMPMEAPLPIHAAPFPRHAISKTHHMTRIFLYHKCSATNIG